MGKEADVHSKGDDPPERDFDDALPPNLRRAIVEATPNPTEAVRLESTIEDVLVLAYRKGGQRLYDARLRQYLERYEAEARRQRHKNRAANVFSVVKGTASFICTILPAVLSIHS